MKRRPPGRLPRPTSVESGERILAGARDRDGVWVLGASVAALHSSAQASWVRVSWHLLHSVGWASADGLLTVRHRDLGGRLVEVEWELGAGPELPRFLELVRERTAATVLAQRSVPVSGGAAHISLRTTAGSRLRSPWTAPGGHDPRVWIDIDCDDGVDDSNPQVRALIEAAGRQLLEEVSGL